MSDHHGDLAGPDGGSSCGGTTQGLAGAPAAAQCKCSWFGWACSLCACCHPGVIWGAGTQCSGCPAGLGWRKARPTPGPLQSLGRDLTPLLLCGSVEHSLYCGSSPGLSLCKHLFLGNKAVFVLHVPWSQPHLCQKMANSRYSPCFLEGNLLPLPTGTGLGGEQPSFGLRPEVKGGVLSHLSMDSAPKQTAWLGQGQMSQFSKAD